MTGTRRLIAVAVALVALAATTPAALARTKLVGPAPSSAKIQLIFPLVANDAGLKTFAYAVSTPGSKLYGHYESIRRLAARFGAGKAVTERVVRYLRSIGATAVRPDGTGMSVDATVSVAVAERAFGLPLGSFTTDTQRFIAPVGAGASAVASSIPAALKADVTGVIGLDTQSIVPDEVVTQHARRAVPRTLAHASQAQPSSAYGPASGTRSGCAGGKGIGGFTPNQYNTAYQYTALHSAGYYGAGPADRPDRDRRLQAVGHLELRELLRPEGAAADGVRRRHQDGASARRRDDARPGGADRGGARAGPHPGLGEQRQCRPGGRVVRRSAGPGGDQAAGDLGLPRPVRAVHVPGLPRGRDQLARARPRAGGEHRHHGRRVERRQRLGRLPLEQRQPGRRAGGQLPGVLAVRHRRRRHQLPAEREQHDQ